MAKKSEIWEIPQGRVIDPVLIQFMLDEIGNTFFSVSFYNKAGELREIRRARLNVVSRMANNENSEKARETLAAHNLIPVIDLDVELKGTRDKGWRSFKADRVAAISGKNKSL